MLIADVLYSLDPVRAGLIPSMKALIGATDAAWCALVWCDPQTPHAYVPHVVVDRSGTPRAPLSDISETTASRASVHGRLRSGRTRARRSASIFVARRSGRDWYLVLNRGEDAGSDLRLGRSVGREVERAIWASAYVVRATSADQLGGADEGAETLLEQAERVEEAMDFVGACGLYDRALAVALARGDVHAALHAAWYRGRVLRKQASWDEAILSYEQAAVLSERIGDEHTSSMVLVGMGTVRRHRGDYPEARSIYERVLANGQTLEDTGLESMGYFGLMWIARDTGEPREAIKLGWRAFTLTEGEADRSDVLVTLADLFCSAGRYEDARLANRAVIGSEVRPENTAIAQVNLARLAAIAGDAGQYEAWKNRVDHTSFSEHILIQMQVEDAASLSLLGRAEEAEDAYRLALEHAEAKGFSRYLFVAEEGLDALTRVSPEQQPIDSEELEIRAHLERMCAGATT